jgi:putative copper export protein
VRSLRRSIRAEMLVAALILLITAALTTLTGPPSMS